MEDEEGTERASVRLKKLREVAMKDLLRRGRERKRKRDVQTHLWDA